MLLDDDRHTCLEQEVFLVTIDIHGSTFTRIHGRKANICFTKKLRDYLVHSTQFWQKTKEFVIHFPK